jgi:hypothetical protein
MLAPNTFSSLTDANGLDISMEPPQVITIANTYLAANSKINGNNLPTS